MSKSMAVRELRGDAANKMIRRYAGVVLAAAVLSFSAAPAWPQASGDPLPRRAALAVG